MKQKGFVYYCVWFGNPCIQWCLDSGDVTHFKSTSLCGQVSDTCLLTMSKEIRTTVCKKFELGHIV